MGGADRLAEQERRRVAERERSNQYKDFQGKVAQEAEKVRGTASNDTTVFCDKKKFMFNFIFILNRIAPQCSRNIET